MKEIIDIISYFMGRREQFPDEYNSTIESNAETLLEKVNGLLNDLGIEEAKVSSGWRPPSLNGQVTNAAKKSYHQLGMAVDIIDDKDQTLGKLISSRPELLKNYDLWLEDLTSTRGQYTNWCHLDVGIRADRPSRTFKP